MPEEKHVTGWVGWVIAASIVLMIEGIMQIVYGFAALYHQTWYVVTSSTIYLFDLNTWGYISIISGLVLILAGILLLNGNLFGRTIGLLFVVIGLIESISLAGAAPIWSFLAIVLYLVIGYGILAHGGELKAPKKA